MINRRSTKSATPSTVREVNIAEVLQALWVNESLSRAEITNILGLSATTMAKLMSSLTKDGTIVETASEEAAGKGRPSKHYKLNHKKIGIIIALIGITHCRVMACSPDGKNLYDEECCFKTPGNYSDLIRKIRESTTSAAKRFSKNSTIAFGLSVPGMVSENDHYVQKSHNIKFLNNTKPALDICEGTNYIVRTIQEERALCLAQSIDPRYSELSDLVAIDLSEGFGLGILSNNQLLNGSGGFAGELGHVSIVDDGPQCACGKKGCFEVLASDTALIKKSSTVMNRSLSFEEVAAYIDSSEPKILEVLDEVIRNIAKAIAIAINMLNPQAVLLYAKMLDIKSYNVLEAIKKLIPSDALEDLSEGCIIDIAPISRKFGVAKTASDSLFRSLINERTLT